jgi:cystathionine beta-synthase
MTASEGDKLGAVVEMMRKAGVSQIPVLDAHKRPAKMVHELDVLRGLQSGAVTNETPVSAIAQPIGGLIYPKARVEELFRIFETDQVAIVVDAEKIVGVIGKIDVIDYMGKRGR